MKKRVITISVIACMLIITTTLSVAAGTTKVDALVSSMKLYFNDKQIKGNLIVAKGVTYIPLVMLNNELGFKLNSDMKNFKMNVVERVSKADLLEKNVQLQKENNELKASNSMLKLEKDAFEVDVNSLKNQITDLKNQMQKYIGSVPTDKEYKSLTDIEISGTEEGRSLGFKDNWNAALPFKV
jgi:hypothetical protein